MSGNSRSRQQNMISATGQNGTAFSDASTDFDIAVSALEFPNYAEEKLPISIGKTM
ncbi:hypothetical protein PPOP_2241 [Paenibacillus popilliae ATCC 14706]|uniref:Uncharacterized protein n=1 Tax=Paenibacillus popilliae ATCC 14706 TaxID=1212764 RepID=M9LIG6_PAEPP|nr:hypothetical protein PPOP_2241 [Paenibacillus popilliae ATCC 14706]